VLGRTEAWQGMARVVPPGEVGEHPAGLKSLDEEPLCWLDTTSVSITPTRGSR